MAYNVAFAERLSRIVDENFSSYPDLKITNMFGGFGYLMSGKMCIGTHNNNLVLRVGKKNADALLESEEARVMDFTGKPMSGWVMIDHSFLDIDAVLIARCKLSFDFVYQNILIHT